MNFLSLLITFYFLSLPHFLSPFLFLSFFLSLSWFILLIYSTHQNSRKLSPLFLNSFFYYFVFFLQLIPTHLLSLFLIFFFSVHHIFFTAALILSFLRSLSLLILFSFFIFLSFFSYISLFLFVICSNHPHHPLKPPNSIPDLNFLFFHLESNKFFHLTICHPIFLLQAGH